MLSRSWVEALKRNSSLDQGFADALKQTTSLQTLRLDGNHIDDLGVEVLSEALTQHNSLMNLSIPQSQISHSGVIHLIDMLELNDTLRTLDISGNAIDEAMRHLTCQLILKDRISSAS
mmetsp:Transcript_7946/g.29641  ORF Transcript_7946/g.29641 Transcript_7946/m.29641 type:complete len:118 (-) Transcript_7946:294-647(-)